MPYRRTVNVGGRPYVQVVETTTTGRTRVIRSFGRDTFENRLRADQFLANYNLAKQRASQPPPPGIDLPKVLMGLFGLILGVAVIDALLGGDDEDE